MGENETALQGATGEDHETGGETPKRQSPNDAGKEGEPPSYRKAEEDSTMLTDEERTGEGTGAKAGEYS
jgi:hypothetical protein